MVNRAESYCGYVTKLPSAARFASMCEEEEAFGIKNPNIPIFATTPKAAQDYYNQHFPGLKAVPLKTNVNNQSSLLNIIEKFKQKLFGGSVFNSYVAKQTR